MAIAFQFCLRMCHYKSPGIPGGTKIKWDTSAADRC
jgi:hypothetical protein